MGDLSASPLKGANRPTGAGYASFAEVESRPEVVVPGSPQPLRQAVDEAGHYSHSNHDAGRVQEAASSAKSASVASILGGSDAGAALVDSLLPRPARFFNLAAVPARRRAARTSAETL